LKRTEDNVTHDEHELPQLVIHNLKAKPMQSGYQLISLENHGNIDHYSQSGAYILEKLK